MKKTITTLAVLSAMVAFGALSINPAQANESYRGRLMSCYSEYGQESAKLLADTYIKYAPKLGYSASDIDKDLRKGGC